MQVLAFVDLTNRKLNSNLGGSTLTLPELVQGDEVRIGMRFSKQIEGTATEVLRNINSIRASIGFVDARPTSGTFQLYVDGDAAGSPLSFDATAAQVKSALEEVYSSTATVTFKDGSWLVDVADATEAQLTITGTSVSLEPTAHVRVRSFLVGSKTRHEIRLIRSPLASTSTFSNSIPAAPSITRVQAGGRNGTTLWNEIQALKITPEFRGVYQLRRGFKKSSELSIEDGAEEIQEAIQQLADEDGEFTVTNPNNNTAHITFGGKSMEGKGHDLIEAVVFSAPPGDPTFVLNLNTAELADALRAVDNITTAVLEVEMTIEDENDPDTLYTITPIRVPVRIIRELNWEGLEAAANIDWLRPPHGRTYIPFTEDQIITGSQHYVAPIGDGTNTEYTLTHNLGTRDLHVTLRKNDGESAIVDRQFSVDGEDLYVSYAVTLDSEDDLTIKFKTPPTANQYVATITTAGPISAFQAHTHTIEQIEGLNLLLDDIGSRVETLETFVPTAGISTQVSTNQTTVASWELPEIFEVFPTRATVDAEDVVSIDVEKLPRNGGLLPAKHLTGSLTVANTIPTAPSQNAVYHYTDTTKELVIPGYLGRKGKNISAPAFYAWDGRGFYQVEKIIDSESVYYSSDFSRELFRIHVNEKQLRLNKTFSLDFSFVAAVFNSNTSVHWGVAIDIGIPQGSPTTPSNISTVNFLPPSLDHSFMLTSVPSAHSFGLRVTRQLENLVSVYKVDRVLYGATETSDTSLTTANFIVRGRLVRFDTDNNSPDPRGLVAFNGMAATLGEDGGSSDTKYGIAKI
jgi:nucleotide-binding universal stress UspA family protein